MYDVEHYSYIVLLYLTRYGNIQYIQNHIVKYDIKNEWVICVALKYGLYDLAESVIKNNIIDCNAFHYSIYCSLYTYCDMETVERFTYVNSDLLHIDDMNHSIVYCATHNKKVFAWMLQNCYIEPMCRYNLFSMLLFNGDLENAQYVHNKIHIDMTYKNHICVKHAVKTHNMPIMKWLFTLYNPTTSYHTLYYACKFDFLKCAKYIVYKYKISISMLNDIFLRTAIKFNAHKVIKWIKRFYPTKTIYNYNGIYLCVNNCINEEINNECCVCYENAQIITTCNHYYCVICYKKMKNTCFYCRQKYDIKATNLNYQVSL